MCFIHDFVELLVEFDGNSRFFFYCFLSLEVVGAFDWLNGQSFN